MEKTGKLLVGDNGSEAVREKIRGARVVFTTLGSALNLHT